MGASRPAKMWDWARQSTRSRSCSPLAIARGQEQGVHCQRGLRGGPGSQRPPPPFPRAIPGLSLRADGIVVSGGSRG
eukprot:15444172-Alexandrium_andersonii.AAC.1